MHEMTSTHHARSRRRGITAAVIGAALCLPTQAFAAPAAPDARGETEENAASEAKQLRAKGEASFVAGEFDAALAAFERAHELAPDPTDLFNIGRIHEETGDLPAALARYQEFVSQPRLQLSERRAAAERIEVLRVLVKADESKDEQGTITPAPPPTAADSGGPKPDAGRPLVIVGSTLLGVGAAIAIGGGVGFGLAARRNNDQIENLVNGSNPDRLTLAEAEDIQARGRDFEALQITFLVSGSALAIIGTGLLAAGLLKRKRGQRLEAFAPTFGRDAIALQARWRF